MRTKLLKDAKTQIFDNCVLSILSYGVETRILTERHLDKQAKIQRETKRSMLGIKLKDNIRNSVNERINRLHDVIKVYNIKKWKI